MSDARWNVLAQQVLMARVRNFDDERCPVVGTELVGSSVSSGGAERG